MSTEEEPAESSRPLTTAEKLRRDLSHASKDIASASKTWVGSTAKFVQKTSPKVAATIDDSLERASQTFKPTSVNSRVLAGSLMACHGEETRTTTKTQHRNPR